MDEVMKFVGFLVVAAAVYYVDVLILIKIWNLVIVPLGFHTLTWMQMYGVNIFISAVLVDHSKQLIDLSEDKYEKGLKIIFQNLAALLGAWLWAYLLFR